MRVKNSIVQEELKTCTQDKPLSDEVDLIANCPNTKCVNSTNSNHRWVHEGCGGNMKVIDTGHLRCTKCHVSGEILDWSLECTNLRYKELSHQGLLIAVSVVAALKGISKDWFLRINEAILNQAKRRSTSVSVYILPLQLLRRE